MVVAMVGHLAVMMVQMKVETMAVWMVVVKVVMSDIHWAAWMVAY
jgi:hypothetical protein